MRVPRRLILVLLVAIAGPVARAADPATLPASDPAILAELEVNDAKVRDVVAFSADFVQEKSTPLLRRPLVSAGRVYAKGDRTLWRTDRPEPARMLLDGREVRVHYPAQAVVEVYPVADRLAALAASPMPRLAVLRRVFAFAALDPREMDPSADADRHLGVRMTPTDPGLAEHVAEVRVVLDRATGYVRRGQTVDADGDRTTITFTDVRAGDVTDADVTLDVPPGTRESRPLGG